MADGNLDNVEIVKLLFKQGIEKDIPSLDVGEPGFTTDDRRLYVGSSKGNVEMAKKDYVDSRVNEIDTSITENNNKLDKLSKKVDNVEEASGSHIITDEQEPVNPVSGTWWFQDLGTGDSIGGNTGMMIGNASYDKSTDVQFDKNTK